MMYYIYWMSFALALFVAWNEWWIRIPLLIIAGVFLFLAHREYRKLKDRIEEMEEDCRELIKANARHAADIYNLWHMVDTLDKQKVSDDDAD